MARGLRRAGKVQKQRALAAGLSHGAEIRSKVSGVGWGFRHMASGAIHFSPDAGLNRGLVKSEGSSLQPVTGLELLGFWRKFLRESGLER